jgi:hypothetical protein
MCMPFDELFLPINIHVKMLKAEVTELGRLIVDSKPLTPVPC